MNQQIIDYIKQARSSGMPDTDIRQQLLSAGWPESEVVNAFNFLSQSAPTEAPAPNYPSAIPRKINVKGMVIRGLLGVFPGLIFAFLISAIFRGVLFLPDSISTITFWIIWLLIIFLFGLWGTRSSPEKQTKKDKQFVSDEGLAPNEKIVALIFSIINPIIAGGVLYYIWQKTYPTKAREANRISIIVFIAYIVFTIVYAILTAQLKK